MLRLKLDLGFDGHLQALVHPDRSLTLPVGQLLELLDVFLLYCEDVITQLLTLLMVSELQLLLFLRCLAPGFLHLQFEFGYLIQQIPDVRVRLHLRFILAAGFGDDLNQVFDPLFQFTDMLIEIVVQLWVVEVQVADLLAIVYRIEFLRHCH